MRLPVIKSPIDFVNLPCFTSLEPRGEGQVRDKQFYPSLFEVGGFWNVPKFVGVRVNNPVECPKSN